MNHLMLEHGVRNGQSMTSTEVQKQNFTQIQAREAESPAPLQVFGSRAHTQLNLDGIALLNTPAPALFPPAW